MHAPVRFLFVDDDQVVLRALRGQVTGEWIDARFMNLPEAALDVVASFGAEVLVTDQLMPGKTGVELLHEVAGSHPQVLRVLLTGHADRATAIRAVNLGQVEHVVEKPFADLRPLLRELSAIAVARRPVARPNAAAAVRAFGRSRTIT